MMGKVARAFSLLCGACIRFVVWSTDEQTLLLGAVKRHTELSG